jgi:EAL domain-containing protein (putative c-di-GMP-specific phosphodiesterase class I)
VSGDDAPPATGAARAAVALARERGLVTTAPGVASAEILGLATALGCDRVRGSWIAVPRGDAQHGVTAMKTRQSAHDPRLHGVHIDGRGYRVGGALDL